MNKLQRWFVSRNWYLVGIAVLIFLAFVGFSFLVHKNLFTHFDFNMTVRLQDHIPRRFDTFFSLLSEWGSFEPMLILLIIFLVIKRKWFGVISFGLFGFMHFFEIFGKTFVSHLPPPQFLLRTQQVINFPQFYVRTQNSYPSGHMGRALFMTTFLGTWGLFSKRLTNWQKMCLLSGLFIYDIGMGVSRVYLGEHWTSDVIGGSLLGFVFGLLGAFLVL